MDLTPEFNRVENVGQGFSPADPAALKVCPTCLKCSTQVGDGLGVRFDAVLDGIEDGPRELL